MDKTKIKNDRVYILRICTKKYIYIDQDLDINWS